ASSKRIQYKIAFVGQEVAKEEGDRCWEPGRMRLTARLIAPTQVVAVCIVIAADDKVRRDGAPVILEFARDAVAGRPLLDAVAPLQELVHVRAILLQHVLIIGFRPR